MQGRYNSLIPRWRKQLRKIHHTQPWNRGTLFPRKRMVGRGRLFILLVAFIHAWGSAVHDRIVLVIDELQGRHPVPAQVATFSLIDVRLIDPATLHAPGADFNFLTEVDIAAHAVWSIFHFIIDTFKFPAAEYAQNEDAQMAMMEDKGAWKKWMVSIGLGNYVPLHIECTGKETLDFPVILKTTMFEGRNVHDGRGVHVVHNDAQLHSLINIISARGHTYFLEESLTGLGLAEMGLFGSVFQSKLLSARCVLRTFSVDKIRNSNFNANFTAGDHKTRTTPFIRSHTLVKDDELDVPCGRDLVQATSKMFAQLNYTGPFCSNWKLDRHMAPKMLEVNARMCGSLSLADGDALVLATIVPLAQAVLDSNPDAAYRALSALLHSKNAAAYQRILAEERRALSTGGGVKDGEWIESDTFNWTIRLASLLQTYNLY